MSTEPRIGGISTGVTVVYLTLDDVHYVAVIEDPDPELGADGVQIMEDTADMDDGVPLNDAAEAWVRLRDRLRAAAWAFYQEHDKSESPPKGVWTTDNFPTGKPDIILPPIIPPPSPGSES